MCGRTACVLEGPVLSRACEYRDASQKRRQVAWQSEKTAGMTYRPSFNVSPGGVVACLVSGAHFKTAPERVLQAMIWKMIPSWHKGDIGALKLSTHNCRLETATTTKVFSPALKNGNRCVVVCSGYYEWKTTVLQGKKQASKQPYFIYAPQPEYVKINEPSSWAKDEWSEENGWQGAKLLKLAGIFNTSTDEDGTIVHSCSVLTMEANHVLSWMHSRVPAFLETEENVNAWLDFENVSLNEALAQLHSPSKKSLQWHPVGRAVGNSRCNEADCIKPINLKKSNHVREKSGPTGLMASWLKKEPTGSDKKQSTLRTRNFDEKSERNTKRIKTE
ncbi:embryonic stem cell-specific 5-hydroxymethylcytosine-binding protein [Orussus abietinus]|uniref:embryonic stem cell-specific 5-hydroxymethylcytosine-binding protein n=1 Tax=Orussus abietinus TaxID=222816 RepID=UPI00062684B4|nr:embryonic stem cell-specific 5-hydroxymethylcytosine-binding protein [Orussus abietinus]